MEDKAFRLKNLETLILSTLEIIGHYIAVDTEESIYNHIKQDKGISSIKDGSVFLGLYKREVEDKLIPYFNNYIKLENDDKSDEGMVESKLKELICSTRVFKDIADIGTCKLFDADRRVKYLQEVVSEVILSVNNKYATNRLNLPKVILKR